MAKFISRQKMSKKARKELDLKQRATWSFSPVTKKVESKKLYNRKRKSEHFNILYVLAVFKIPCSFLRSLCWPLIVVALFMCVRFVDSHSVFAVNRMTDWM